MSPETFRQITTSPFYDDAWKSAGTYDTFRASLAVFKDAMTLKFGPASNSDEIACAFTYAWGLIRMSRLGSDFSVIAPEVRRELEAVGHSWDQLIDMMGSPKPNVAFAYTDNL